MKKRIGFLGGGQLGRMSAIAARTAGHEVYVLDPDPQSPARAVADLCLTVPFSDLDAVRTFASACDVVTLDREDVPIAAVAAASIGAETYPSPEALATIQNKFTQKQWLSKLGAPTPEFRLLTGEKAEADLRFPGFLKSSVGGFDGRGVIRVESAEELHEFAGRFRATGAYFESQVEFEREISVLVARRPNGEAVVYEPALNHHSEHMLDWSVFGAALDPLVSRRARDLALSLAEELRLVGLLVVEMFVTSSGEVLVNEMAPRPHNSYHGADRAFVTGQFEQHIRALAGVPLGSIDRVSPTAIANLLGDLWSRGEPSWERALRLPTVKLHLYGKSDPRPRRKMGHLSATAPTAAEALEAVQHARELACPDLFCPASTPNTLQRSL